MFRHLRIISAWHSPLFSHLFQFLKWRVSLIVICIVLLRPCLVVLAAGRPGCTTCQTLQCTRVHGNGTQCMVMVPRYPQSINFMQANRHHFPIDENHKGLFVFNWDLWCCIISKCRHAKRDLCCEHEILKSIQIVWNIVCSHFSCTQRVVYDCGQVAHKAAVFAFAQIQKKSYSSAQCAHCTVSQVIPGSSVAR